MCKLNTSKKTKRNKQILKQTPKTAKLSHHMQIAANNQPKTKQHTGRTNLIKQQTIAKTTKNIQSNTQANQKRT